MKYRKKMVLLISIFDLIPLSTLGTNNNLHGRLGFNSTWHLIAAAFNGSPFFHIEANSINFSALCCFILYFLMEAKLTGSKDYRSVIIFLALPILLIYHFIDPSAELILYFFGLALLLEILHHEKDPSKGDIRFWLLAFPFLVTIKINFVLYLPLLLYYLFKSIIVHSNQIKLYFTLLATSAILFATSWFISNLVISGYLVYPFIPSPFPLRWAVPNAEAAEQMAGIRNTPVIRWAGISATEAARNSIVTNFVLWFKHVRLVEKLIFLVFSLLLVTNAVRDTWLRKLALSQIILFQFINQMMLVPDLRFSIALGIIGLFQCKQALFKQRVEFDVKFITLALVLQLIITFYLYHHIYLQLFKSKPNVFSWFYKLPYHQETYEKVNVDGVSIFINTANDFLWDSVPAFYLTGAIKKYPSEIGLINDNIQDGFYTKPKCSSKQQ